MNKKLAILVADDHDIVRFGLSTVINSSPDMHVVAEAANGPQCVIKYAEFRPDVSILDISMPELNGIETTREILKLNPDAVILILTMHINEDYLEDVLKAGALGYILKNCNRDELLNSIRKAYQKEFVFSSSISEMIKDHFVHQLGVEKKERKKTQTEARHLFQSLTQREKEVVQLVGKGMTSAEISEKLFISPRTVDTHRARIMEKLHLRSKSDIVRFVLEHPTGSLS